MTYEYDFLVFIGRFQPFHCGHEQVIRAGLARAKQVIVLCGSAHQPRSTRNPWRYQEREQMIRSAFAETDQPRLCIAPLMDCLYNEEQWVQRVQTTVQGILTAYHKSPHQTPKVGLIGHQKDASAYYLNLFPQWSAVSVPNVAQINATDIRQSLFVQTHDAHVDDDCAREAAVNYLQGAAEQVLPSSVIAWLTEFVTKAAYLQLAEEVQFVQRYQSAWSAAPYPPTFVTVDAVVVQSGHILMVERKAKPGKGLWALPGGFLDPHETLQEACLRELKEETKIKVPLAVLKGSIRSSAVFDDPYRSARGRTITHAYYIELAPHHELPKVKGGDDAKQAKWVPLGSLDPETIFEDHYFIIQKMI